MSRLSLILALGVCCPTASLQADDWPQFRGPNSSGISTSEKTPPVKFGLEKNLAWSAEIGDGIGCPVVAAGRVFVSAMVDAETVGLFAFDAKSGKKLWERTWPAGDLAEIHLTNSHASTTPAADAERVYFYFSTLGLLTVDAQTGTDVWRQELPVPFFVFKWGPGMSPILYKDLVIFLQDDDLNPAIYAYDKRTGGLKWHEDRSEMAVNYSHPVICHTDSGDELIVAGTGLLIGYAPLTGKRLWHARTLLRNIKTTPVVQDGVIYISQQSGGIANQWLASVDRVETGNSDGKLSKAEIQAFVGKRPIPEAFFKRTFDRGDKNGDGQLEGEELDQAFLFPGNFAGARYDAETAADEQILAVRGGGRGDVTETHILWKHPTKYTDHIVSPLVADGRMLLIKCGGIATCFDATSGDSLFGPGRLGSEGNYFASPIYSHGKIYIGGENGQVVVMESGPKLNVLAVNDLEDPVIGTPAIADGRLFVRTRTRLLAFAESPEK